MSHACKQRAQEDCSSPSHMEDPPLDDRMHASSSASYIKIVHLIYSILPCVTEKEQMLDKFLHHLLLVDPFSSSFTPSSWHSTTTVITPTTQTFPQFCQLFILASFQPCFPSVMTSPSTLSPLPHWSTPSHSSTPLVGNMECVVWSLQTVARNR